MGRSHVREIDRKKSDFNAAFIVPGSMGDESRFPVSVAQGETEGMFFDIFRVPLLRRTDHGV